MLSIDDYFSITPRLPLLLQRAQLSPKKKIPLSHAVDYDFGTCGISMSDIAISSRSCTERHGDFSESVVFHSSYEVSCFLFVVWLGSLVFVFVVCLCWLLLGCWMGDTLGIVSLYSHAWEWTI